MSWSWSDTRALLIALVLVPNLIFGLPIPKPVTQRALQTPQRQRELTEWTRTLQQLGFDVTEEQVGTATIAATTRAASLHRQLKAPFYPLVRTLGVNQAWPLFAAATTTPTRLTVEVVRRDGQRVTWFRRNDPDHRWNDRFFRYRRVRGVYDVTGARPGPAYDPFTRTVAEAAFAEDPDVVEVIVSLHPVPLTFPWEPPLPEGRALHRRVHRRSEAR